MSTFKAYLVEGNYTLGVRLESMNPEVEQNSMGTIENRTDIIIEDPISDLFLLTFFCQLNQECIVEYSIGSGMY